MQTACNVSLQGAPSEAAAHARSAEGVVPAAPAPEAAGPAPEAAEPALEAAGLAPKTAGAGGIKNQAKQSLEELAAWLDAQLAAAPGKVLMYSLLTALMVETAGS